MLYTLIKLRPRFKVYNSPDLLSESHAIINDLDVMLVGWFDFVFMVFNATFNNISVISWRSVLFEPTTSVIIGTDCIGSCKSNYHVITDTTAPR